MTTVLGGRWFGWALYGATFWLLSACQGESSREGEDGDDDEPSGYCGRFATTLRGCGMGALVQEFDTCTEPDDEDGRCEAGCIVNASCDDLRTAICANATPLDLAACFDGCLPPPFTCGSGEGEVPASWLCDGFPDCSDGSDEAVNCPTCDNGVTLPEFAMCDGFRDCADGRDELGCPTFTCRSGETLPEFVECDFYLDCADGSDEHAECPGVFPCRNGDFIPVEWECDGEADCLDGSDEHGACPSVTCADGSTAPGERCDGYLDCLDASDEPTNCPPTPLEEACGTG